jgi:hypothetical protein
MRTLAITLPVKKAYAESPLRVRVGTEQEAQFDTFDNLSQTDSQGIVSAWSAEFDAKGGKEAGKLVERRFKVAQRVISVWEETGESIARHLWYVLCLSSMAWVNNDTKGRWHNAILPYGRSPV